MGDHSISRRMFLRNLAVGAASCYLAGALPQRLFAQGTEKHTVKHVVFILIDDLGARDLGCTGSDYYETPHLDRFAKESVMFTDAYAACPVCSPTRASLLTGRYPARLQLTSYLPGPSRPYAKLSPPNWRKYVPASETTYADAFRAAGFRTCHIGKWHIGNVGPDKRGFDDVTPECSAKNMDDPWYVDYYSSAAERFMEQHRDQPFLLTLSHGTVHVPLYEHAETIDRYRKKPAGKFGQDNPIMAAMIERMDHSMGRVLKKIDDLGIAEETAVIFYSDNGGLSQVYDAELGRVVTATSNLPYRGGKSQCYEGGIRVPLLIRWPGMHRPGAVYTTPVISNDLYPTMLEMAGIPQRPAQHLDGLSLAGVISANKALPRNTLYWHYPHYQSLPPHGAIRCGDWKLIEHYEDNRLELYNLKTDIGETRNLAEQSPEVAATLRTYLHAHLQTIGAQMPTPNPRYDPARKESGSEGADPYEWNQQGDPRKIVSDPTLDYGMLRECP